MCYGSHPASLSNDVPRDRIHGQWRGAMRWQANCPWRVQSWALGAFVQDGQMVLVVCYFLQLGKCMLIVIHPDHSSFKCFGQHHVISNTTVANMASSHVHQSKSNFNYSVLFPSNIKNSLQKFISVNPRHPLKPT